ncbi:hypothetical protein [Wolbachia endosymbiont of Trichogramma pretiosum]|uniref:hypothetical protein n=1 Tax=Wolbachia endosymbiont of Trichogramma pretiosum TaxID=125593 RepID=UPI0008395ACA|nr:hypothetical protein [Wolbachia endosymbiont of Trichogramma pretiosum]OCA06375.1 hypothetical protein wTpre_707 [Wolbachia endosymbiont of Trichogramma pretiosum]
MTTTIKDAADDDGFIKALIKLKGFNDKVYIKAAPADEVYTKTAADTTFVKATELKTKVAEQAVVDILVPALATVGTDDTKKVYTKGTVDTSFAKIDASNLTEANQKAFAEAILPAKDGQKSILINELGEALDRVADDKSADKVYGAKGSEKISKDFLADKGLKPMPEDVAAELAKNPEFQADVKTLISQPSFEIPIDPSEPLSWDW